MEIDKMQQIDIYGYFHIDKQIERMKMGISGLRDLFYDQTMASYTTSGDTEIYSKGFNPESVIHLVDVTNSLDICIERLQKKKSLFNECLNSFPLGVKQSLIDRYSGDNLPDDIQHVDVEIFNKVQAIDDEINGLYGYPLNVRKEFMIVGGGTSVDNLSILSSL